MSEDTTAPQTPEEEGEPAKGGVKLSVLLPLLIFLGIAGFFVWGLLKGNPRLLPSVLIGKMAPEFDLPPLEGIQTLDGLPAPGLSTKDLKAPGVKMLSFFASWCTGCRAEHPFLVQLARNHVIPLVGIAYKDPHDKSLAWLEELGNPYSRIGVDRKGRTGIDFGVYGIPESFFINSEGRIIYKYIGPLDARAWKNTVTPELEKAVKKYGK
jgi:cytochrome c biogenesis protein CcmG/thiol:disulfide interchange protein DsbE